MDFPSYFFNPDLAGFIIALAGQSFLVSLIGLILIRAVRKRPAPVRSIVCGGIIAAMGFLLLISAGFYQSGISWPGASIPLLPGNSMTCSPVSPTVLISSGQDNLRFSESFPTAASLAEEIHYTVQFPDHHTGTPSLTVTHYINIAGFFWIAGILYHMVKLAYGLMLVKNFRNNLRPVTNGFHTEILKNVARRFWKTRVPGLYSSSEIESPVTIGLVHPAVIVPEKLLSALDENELNSIFLHELAHIYHGDHFAGLLKRTVLAFHWWNPAAYIINREHDQAREDVSDNHVLMELNPGTYTRCLVGLAEKVCLISNFPTAVGMAGKSFNLGIRVENILSRKRNISMSTGLVCKILTPAFLTVITLGIAGFNGKVQHGTDTVIKDLKRGTNPDNTLFSSVKTNPISPEERIMPDPHYFDEAPVKEKEFQKSNGKMREPGLKSPLIAASHPSVTAQELFDNIIKPHSIQLTGEPVIEWKTPEDILPVQTDLANNIYKEHALISGKADIVPEPNVPASFILLGKAHYKENNFIRAAKAFSSAIEINPDDPVIYYLRGNAYFKAGQIDMAISDYTRAVEINPGYAKAYAQRGYTYDFKRKQYDKAIADYSRAIELDPAYTRAYIQRGYAYQKSEEYTSAVYDYQTALKLDPHADFPDKMMRLILKKNYLSNDLSQNPVKLVTRTCKRMVKPSRRYEEVKFYSLNDSPGDYEQMGTINVISKNFKSDLWKSKPWLNAFYKELKERAARLGANGILFNINNLDPEKGDVDFSSDIRRIDTGVDYFNMTGSGIRMQPVPISGYGEGTTSSASAISNDIISTSGFVSMMSINQVLTVKMIYASRE